MLSRAVMAGKDNFIRPLAAKKFFKKIQKFFQRIQTQTLLQKKYKFIYPSHGHTALVEDEICKKFQKFFQRKTNTDTLAKKIRI